MNSLAHTGTDLMTTFHTLENISTEKILEVFNSAFSDYVVPFHLSKEQLENKIKNDSIQLKYSVGAFEDDQLVAFILHAYDVVDGRKMIYNAGTGVIPAKRGNSLTAKLYEYVLPTLMKEGVDKVILEVITTNEPAIKTYKKIGFKIVRQLECFKGSLSSIEEKAGFDIRELPEYDWQKLRSFWDFNPSWQNSVTAVENLSASNVSLGIYEDEKLVGYIIYNPGAKRIQQIAVEKNSRGKAAGQQLLRYVTARYGSDISVINVDDSSENTLNFMLRCGLKNFITQYEMVLPLK